MTNGTYGQTGMTTSGLSFINIKINGTNADDDTPTSDTCTYLLDTGANESTVPPGVAKDKKLVYKGIAKQRGAGGVSFVDKFTGMEMQLQATNPDGTVVDLKCKEAFEINKLKILAADQLKKLEVKIELDYKKKTVKVKV